MKIAVLTDVHGNLPALQVALRAIRREGADAIFHTGDAIGIGPFPAECLELLLSTPGVNLICGNHDAWFSTGLPEPQPPWMSDGELKHQQWVPHHAYVCDKYGEALKRHLVFRDFLRLSSEYVRRLSTQNMRLGIYVRMV